MIKRDYTNQYGIVCPTENEAIYNAGPEAGTAAQTVAECDAGRRHQGDGQAPQGAIDGGFRCRQTRGRGIQTRAETGVGDESNDCGDGID